MSKYYKAAGDCPVCGGMYWPGETCEVCGFNYIQWMEWRAIRPKVSTR
jgi:hypothetical protein